MPAQAVLRIRVLAPVVSTGDRTLVFSANPVSVIAGGDAVTVTTLWRESDGTLSGFVAGELVVASWQSAAPPGISAVINWAQNRPDQIIVTADNSAMVGVEVLLNVEGRP